MRAPPIASIVAEHLDEARFLRLRRQRVFAVLHGNAAHQRSLERRMDAHLHALASDPSTAMGPWEEALSGDDEHAYFAAAASRAMSDAAEGLWAAWAREAPRFPRAARDVLWFHGASATPLLERWLSGDDPALQALSLAVLCRRGDPRTEALGRWAMGHGDEGVRAEGLHALATAGVREAAGWGASLFAGVRRPALMTKVLEDVARLDATEALAIARSMDWPRLAEVDGAAVLRGMGGTAGDAEALVAALGVAPTAAVCVGVALAGAAGALDGLWARSAERDVHNALREAAYVTLGDEVPPGGLGARAEEDEADRDARMRENATLAARMRAGGGARGRWGGQPTEALSARHRRWAGIVRGERVDWEALAG